MQEPRDKLLNQIMSRMKTTFIGNLSDIEKELGFLWGHGKTYNELNEDERYFRSIWLDLRKKILDRGNDEIDKLKQEYDLYDVQYRRFKMVLPVRQPNE